MNAMKVRDLIKDTAWTPGRQYDEARPYLSVLMPTYRRGSDGLFQRAARSVLDQTERNIELIIVDDASTDGTAAQIDSLMQADGRVSCLRHGFNVALPAISEYEAFRRARGEYLAFAFDDFVFEADALGKLLEAAARRKGAVIHGSAELQVSDTQAYILGNGSFAYEKLAFGNFFANASFIVPRFVVEDVGLYDPHIAAARLCDWDLWRRILRDYPIYREEVFVGRELGLSRADSLGRTYPLHFEALQEYFGQRRNERLRPGRFEDFDVWEMPRDSSSCLTAHVISSRRFFKDRSWAKTEALEAETESNALLSPRRHTLGIYSDFPPIASLCFDGLLDRFPQDFLFLLPDVDDAALQLHLARCDAVILVRALLDPNAKRAIAACKAMNIPLYYLLDDNLVALGEEFTLEGVAAALSDFAGVVCTSAPLADYLTSLKLHSSIERIDPAFDPGKFAKLKRVPASATEPALRVGFIGDAVHLANLNTEILPALTDLCGDGAIALFSRLPLELTDGLPFSVSIAPFAPSLDAFLLAWRAIGPDVLVQPRGDSKDLGDETGSFLLSALYLGAVPIVAGEPTVLHVGEQQGVLKVDGGAASWEHAVRRALDADFRRLMLERLEAFCRSTFSGDRTAKVIENIFAAYPPTDFLTWANRIRQLQAESIAGLAHVRAATDLNAAQVARLEAEAVGRGAQVHGLEEEVQGLEEEVQGLEEEVQGLEEEVQGLEEEVQAREERLRDVLNEAEVRESSLKHLQVEIEFRESRLKHLQVEAEARELYLKSLESGAERSAKTVQALEREVNSRAYAVALKFRAAAHFGRRVWSFVRGRR
jgi:glycosyltransferase involved in cell wall biosynthesis